MSPRLRVKLASLLVLPALAACGGGGGTSGMPLTPSAPLTTHRALVIGGASGPVYDTLSSQYQVTAGTGGDPSSYDMVVFDGNTTTPQSLNLNPELTRFLLAGKAVVLLDNTEAHREQGLHGLLFAHAKGSSPGTIYFLARGANGAPPREVEIEFPLHLTAGAPGKPPTVTSPDTAELAGDAKSWLAEFQKRFGAAVQKNNIDPADAGAGQTVFSDDIVQPLTVAVPSFVNTMTPGNGLEFCSSVTSPNTWGSCDGKNPAIATPDVGGGFETMINVLLERNGSNYMHKIIERQYAFFSTYPWPNPQWSYGFWMADALNGTNNADLELSTMLGFNDSVALSAGPTWLSQYPMAVIEAQPTASNNTSNLTTSYSKTEQVGLSVTGGYQAGAVGLLGANWSDSWSWSQANSIDISDWSSDVAQQGSNVVYNFRASGNTPDTWQNLRNATLTGDASAGYNAPGFSGLKIGSQYLNPLQKSAIVSQDETEWATSNGPIGPQTLEFDASATFTSGEVFQMAQSVYGNTYTYGNFPSATIDEPVAIDFADPSLQPPAQAPWSLSFGAYHQKRGSATATTTGTVTLNQPAPTNTQVDLSYVIQPQQQMLTLPSSEACQGNTTSFNPGNSVLDNGNPPLAITIPAGQASASFPLTFQTFNSDTYNVQVVAWLPSTDLGGQNVTNPQSAWCLTPPNTLP